MIDFSVAVCQRGGTSVESECGTKVNKYTGVTPIHSQLPSNRLTECRFVRVLLNASFTASSSFQRILKCLPVQFAFP